MSTFKQYKRKAIAELRSVTQKDTFWSLSKDGVSISDVDGNNGSPKEGDMIARALTNHKDQWLVNKQYFKDNFEPKG